MSRRLRITVNEHCIGELRERKDLWDFEYDPRWIAAPHAFNLSPALDRTAGLHADGASDRPVQWYFDNLLPEEDIRTVLAREASVAREDAFGLLAYFGAESAGSLVLQDPEHPIEAERGLKPLPLAELSRRIDNLPQVSLDHDAPKHMSAAGAQHKLAIVLRGTELFEPLPGTASTHILKPNHASDDYPASVINEYFTMRLAAAVGLTAPAVTRLFVPQPVYIVQRFDRMMAPAPWPEARRRHIIDTCQLLNKSRSFKFTGATVESLARAIQLCRSRAAARLQLYNWLIFNILTGNGDNHLKNISFIVDHSGIELAPVYDLLSTAVYDTRAFANDRAQWPRSRFAFMVGSAANFAEVTREQILIAGDALGLAPGTAARELNRLAKAVPEQAAKLIDSIHSDSEQEIARSPDPTTARRFVAAETRVLHAIQHIVIRDMVERISER